MSTVNFSEGVVIPVVGQISSFVKLLQLFLISLVSLFSTMLLTTSSSLTRSVGRSWTAHAVVCRAAVLIAK